MYLRSCAGFILAKFVVVRDSCARDAVFVCSLGKRRCEQRCHVRAWPLVVHSSPHLQKRRRLSGVCTGTIASGCSHRFRVGLGDSNLGARSSRKNERHVLSHRRCHFDPPHCGEVSRTSECNIRTLCKRTMDRSYVQFFGFFSPVRTRCAGSVQLREGKL